MDLGLFKKYSAQIEKQSASKQELLTYIFEKTGISLSSEEILIVKKKITLQTSSVKKSKLLQKSLTSFLQEKGYTLQP